MKWSNSDDWGRVETLLAQNQHSGFVIFSKSRAFIFSKLDWFVTE